MRTNKEDKRFGKPISPVIVSRAPIFQPRFKHLQNGTMEAETEWAKVKVTGKLGAQHRKILDAIFAEYVDLRRSSGTAIFIVDPYRIAKIAGVTPNPRRIREVLEDMRVAQIEIFDKRSGDLHVAGIVSEFVVTKKTVDGPGGFCQERPLLKVTISAGWMKIWESGLIGYYRDVLPILGEIPSGATYMVALHMLTHRGASNYGLDTILQIIGAYDGITSEARKSQIRKEVKRCKSILKRLGIEIDVSGQTGVDQVRYRQPSGVAVMKARGA